MGNLTLNTVKERVEKVRKMSGDDEGAHSEEDKLHVDVLQAIAFGTCDDPQACAMESLKTLDIEFSRWCA